MEQNQAPSRYAYRLNSPLWSRAPGRDENGKPYIDFMMLIPGLKKESEAVIEAYLVKIRDSLAAYDNVVVYVELNTRLNLLWVSAKPVPGILKPIIQAIQRAIPHARVVAGDFNPDSFSEERKSVWYYLRRGISGLPLRLAKAESLD